MQSILVTGGAGFIGTNLIGKLLENGFKVSSVDNLDDYYFTEIKLCNSRIYKDHPNYQFIRLHLLDKEEFFSSEKGSYDVVDITKAKKLLHYQPKVSLEEGLKSYISHLKVKYHQFFSSILPSTSLSLIHPKLTHLLWLKE